MRISRAWLGEVACESFLRSSASRQRREKFEQGARQPGSPGDSRQPTDRRQIVNATGETGRAERDDWPDSRVLDESPHGAYAEPNAGLIQHRLTVSAMSASEKT